MLGLVVGVVGVVGYGYEKIDVDFGFAYIGTFR